MEKMIIISPFMADSYDNECFAPQFEEDYYVPTPQRKPDEQPSGGLRYKGIEYGSRSILGKDIRWIMRTRFDVLWFAIIQRRVGRLFGAQRI